MPWMLSNIIKNLTNKPVTRAYPFEKKENFPGSRGEIKILFDRCCFCGMCQRGCPAQAIKLYGSRKDPDCTIGYNPFACIYCGKCVETCPCCAIISLDHHPPASYVKTTYIREDEPCE